MKQKMIQKSSHLGFTSLGIENQEIKLSTSGNLPTWISGSLTYIGPAKFSTEKDSVNHLFDGLAMLHHFKFHEGQIRYSNFFLKTSSYFYFLKNGSLSYEGFAQETNNSIIKRILTIFNPLQINNKTKNASFNITKINDQYIALAPFCNPVSFSPENCENIDLFNYEDNIKNNGYENPYPVYDINNKEHISFMVNVDNPISLILYKIKDGNAQREIITSLNLDRLYYSPGLSVTKKYIVLTLCPLVAHSRNMLIKGKPFIKNFKWEPKLGTTFIVIDRETGAIIEKNSTTPFFALHKINAYENEDIITIDMISYSDCSFIDQFYFENINNQQNLFNSGQLTRYKIILNQSKVWNEIISNCKIDFPQINQEYVTKDYKYVYGSEFCPYTVQRNYNTLLKINVKTHDVQHWFEPHGYPGIPIFISHPQGESEEEGIIASIVLDTQKKRSFLVLLEGSKFTEVARAEIPHHVPFGLHGIYSKDK